MLDATPDLATLAAIPGNRLERLRGDRKNQYSIRVHDQWRICFESKESDACEVDPIAGDVHPLETDAARDA